MNFLFRVGSDSFVLFYPFKVAGVLMPARFLVLVVGLVFLSGRLVSGFFLLPVFLTTTPFFLMARDFLVSGDFFTDVLFLPVLGLFVKVFLRRSFCCYFFPVNLFVGRTFLIGFSAVREVPRGSDAI